MRADTVPTTISWTNRRGMGSMAVSAFCVGASGQVHLILARPLGEGDPELAQLGLGNLEIDGGLRAPADEAAD